MHPCHRPTGDASTLASASLSTTAFSSASDFASSSVAARITAAVATQAAIAVHAPVYATFDASVSGATTANSTSRHSTQKPR